MTNDEYNLLFHKTQANRSAFKRLMDCDAEVIKMIEAAVESKCKRLQELADYRLKLLTKMPSEWVGLTDEDMEGMFLNAEGIRIARYIETRLKEKNCG